MDDILLECPGIIPAYAGSTYEDLLAAAGGEGSSPHTRGALSTASSCGGLARIIPAYAGSTQIHLNSTGDIRDHPRIRGEHGRPERQPP